MPDQMAVHFGGQRGLGQTRADLGGNVDRSNATRILQGLSVGEGDFEHGSPVEPEVIPPSGWCIDTKDAPRIPRVGFLR